MKNKITAALFLLLMILPVTSFADLINCGQHSIESISIQGDRDDNSVDANNAFLYINGDACSGTNLFYIENSNPNYNAILSILMTAYSMGKDIELYVNSSKTIPSATQISIVVLRNR